MDPLNPNFKGNVAEAAIVAEAVRCGINVLRPQVEHCRYDLAFDFGKRIARIQCKWAALRNEVIMIRAYSSRYRSDGAQVTKAYTAAEVDAIAAYCDELRKCYLIPLDLLADRRVLHLRLRQPLNRQRAAINWASDYELPGAVAQLGRAFGWQPKGRGFESHQLHPPPSDGEQLIGANAFRDHLGWYMERAAAGEAFTVTRRGRRYVRVSSAAHQPRLVSAAVDREAGEH